MKLGSTIIFVDSYDVSDYKTITDNIMYYYTGTTLFVELLRTHTSIQLAKLLRYTLVTSSTLYESQQGVP